MKQLLVLAIIAIGHLAKADQFTQWQYQANMQNLVQAQQRQAAAMEEQNRLIQQQQYQNQLNGVNSRPSAGIYQQPNPFAPKPNYNQFGN